MKLFILQNDNDLKNARILNSFKEIQFIDVSPFCGDKINFDNSEIKAIKINRISKVPYYKSKKLFKFMQILFVNIDVLDYSKITSVYMGNDGAIQRKIISKIKKINRQATVELWIDGLLEKHEPTLSRKILRILSSIAFKLRCSWLVPSEVGTSALVDRVKVLSESCRQSLLFNGVPSQKVSVGEFQRIKDLKNKIRTDTNKRILLVVSAFGWHGRADIELWEESLVEQFARIQINDVTISIRPHPRSGHGLKSIIGKSGLESKNKLVEDDIVNSDLIISFASTCLLEAYLIGKSVLVYEKDAPYISRGDFIEGLPKLNDLSEIVEFMS